MLEDFEGEEEYQLQIINIGFNIFILFNYLKDQFPEDHENFYLFLDEEYVAPTKGVSEQNNVQIRQEEENEADINNGKYQEYIKFYQKKAEKFKSNKEQNNSVKQTKKIITEKTGLLRKQTVKKQEKSKNLFSIFMSQKTTKSYEIFSKSDRFYVFYKKLIGNTEVQTQDNKLVKVYFKKPLCCKFLTVNVKDHIIFKADRDNNQDRLQFLMDNFKFYYIQMKRKQQITKNYKLLSILANNWRFLKDISYILVLVITIIMIVQKQDIESDGTNSNSWDDSLKEIVAIIQLIISSNVLIFCAIERYPLSMHLFQDSQNLNEIIKIKQISEGQYNQSLQDWYNKFMNSLKEFLSPENSKTNHIAQAILIVLDFDNIYNAVYLILTILAVIFKDDPLIYAILLLDIVKRSQDLQNVIESFTRNLKNLLKFAFLGLIVIYIYAIIGYIYFKDYFQPDEASGAEVGSFILAITSVIKEGLRNGGGLADSLKNVDFNTDQGQDDLWPRYIYDLSFFIIINMLFIQIIFGIILDTFGSLRDERNQLLAQINEICFICGQERQHINTSNKNGWYHHIYQEHNLYNMLFYIIYVFTKDINECAGLEKYVKEQITGESIDFIPINRSYEEDLQKNVHKQSNDE